jgi:hypothetical protein
MTCPKTTSLKHHTRILYQHCMVKTLRFFFLCPKICLNVIRSIEFYKIFSALENFAFWALIAIAEMIRFFDSTPHHQYWRHRNKLYTRMFVTLSPSYFYENNINFKTISISKMSSKMSYFWKKQFPKNHLGFHGNINAVRQSLRK